MDVENMHPFCLPFGFCHDATSSSVMADLGLILNDTSSSSNSNNTSSNNNNNSNDKDRTRLSKNSSPSDELFRHLNNQATPSISQTSFLQNELIMNSSSAFDHIIKDSHDSFFSLEFDINIGADNSSLDTGMDMDFLTNDDDDVTNNDDHHHNHHHHHHHDHHHHQHHHHHMVDPMDIKSSPTLAQLNLNNNDDPNDGIWSDHHNHTSRISIPSNHCVQIQTRQPATRPVSPVLVTSSSSPLSHQSPLQAPTINPTIANTKYQQTNPRGSLDNKLKENIDYLTQLLCQGNKIDNGDQPGISSTMTRSYTTLAQTLSAEPKLLNSNNNNNTRPYHIQGHNGQLFMAPNPHKTATSEASSRLSPSVVQLSSPTSQHHLSKRLYHMAPEPSGLRNPQVESSISAADSTELQAIISPSDSCLRDQQLGQHPGSQQQVFCHQTYQPTVVQQVNENQRPRSSDLKVLSSLLSGDQHAGINIQRSGFVDETSPMAANDRQVGLRYEANLSPLATGSALHKTILVRQPTNECRPNEQQVNSVCYEGNISPLAGAHQKMLVRQAADMAQGKISQLAQQDTPAAMPINNVGHLKQEFSPITSQLLSSPSMSDNRSSMFVQPASPMQTSNFETPIGRQVDYNEPPGGKRKRPAVQPQQQQQPQLQLQQQQPALVAVSNHLVVGKGQATSKAGNMRTDCSVSSHDEGFSSQLGDNEDANSTTKDSDDEDDVDSDDESFYGDYTNNDLIGASISDDPENKWILNMGRTRRNGQKRFFWQYNVQSKGPKGTRICSSEDLENPFVLSEASDPVFSNDCQVEGVKHSGKARRGDGNDLTPNPKKLLMIGLELKKLGKIINDLAPVTELPVNARDKTRKEKNKLASRACRLKKKAQHEANKIKLYGLQREHQRIVTAIFEIRKALNEALEERDSNGQATKASVGPLLVAVEQSGDIKQLMHPEQLASSSSSNMESQQAPDSVSASGQRNNDKLNSRVEMIAEQCSMKVAGQTSDYVNSVLEKVVAGCIDGGLQT